MVGSVLIPSLRYQDARAAIAWLERAFGFERHALYDGPEGTVAHAELRLGTGMIMVGSASNPGPYTQMYAMPEEIGGRVTSPMYLVVGGWRGGVGACQGRRRRGGDGVEGDGLRRQGV